MLLDGVQQVEIISQGIDWISIISTFISVFLAAILAYWSSQMLIKRQLKKEHEYEYYINLLKEIQNLENSIAKEINVYTEIISQVDKKVDIKELLLLVNDVEVQRCMETLLLKRLRLDFFKDKVILEKFEQIIQDYNNYMLIINELNEDIADPNIVIINSIKDLLKIKKLTSHSIFNTCFETKKIIELKIKDCF